MDREASFHWKCEPVAESLILNLLDTACRKNSFISELEKDLKKQTSTRLLDWVDHISVNYSEGIEKALEESGFTPDHTAKDYRVYVHEGALFPRIVLKDESRELIDVAVTVDSIADFLMVRGLSGNIEGAPLSQYRRCVVSTDNGASLLAIERRGTTSLEPSYPGQDHLAKVHLAEEKWKTRPRDLEDEDEMMAVTLSIAEQVIDLVGEDFAACLVLGCERAYWQSKNVAGQVQKNRQDRLGMGWANHDHHTFRSSRKHFSGLIRLFEMLGFHCRERFYAGKEAGWGAQVMENKKAKLVLFLDVDLKPEEMQIDFRYESLADAEALSTVGLWCALHGDSIFKSGMHHLEAQFAFNDLRQDLKNVGIDMMDPFSDLPFLKQAFTKGEVWKVDPKRVQKLLTEKKITEKQAEKFLSEGALGSHLENLQRKEGYKGFNPRNVSSIIQKTDPRLGLF